MIYQLIVLCVLIFFETVIPPAITPFSYSMITTLLVEHVNTIFLALLVIWTSVFSSLLTWYFFDYLVDRIRKYQIRHHYQDWISVTHRWVLRFMKKHRWFNRFSIKLQKYIDTTEGGKFTLFVFTVITLASALPDIVTIRIVKKHMHITTFLIAGTLGKALAYLPVIFLGKEISFLILHMFW